MNKLTDLEALECIVVDLTQLAKKLNKQEIEQVRKSLEILEIIKKNPELVWCCCCYENATQLLMDRMAFRLNDNVDEIIEDFNKVKEWLNDK